MDKFVTDQAEGLRRLLAREGPRVIAVTRGSGSTGRTTTVVNLAAALVAVGRRVLVIDECGDAPGNDRIDPLDAVLRDGLPLADVVERRAPGFDVLKAPRASVVRYTSAQFDQLLRGAADVVLIDARLDAAGALSSLALNAHDVLLVTGTDAQAITGTYACIKRLHFAHAIGQFRVIANHVHNPIDARIVLDNLVSVAGRYLAVALERAGYIAADPHMARAVELARPIVDAFPSTAAARDYRTLAADLPHWPLRPALAAAATEATTAVTRLTAVPEVTTVTSTVEAVTADAGWQTGTSARQRDAQHA